MNLLRSAISAMRRPRRPRASPVLDEVSFSGSYQRWEDALRDSAGYADPEILAKTRESILKVMRGEAAYERDSMLLDQAEPPFPMIAGLLRAALAAGGRLCVVDYGGSLGSSYFQCRELLQPIRQIEWLVVEQPAHVECGRREMENDELRFYETASECFTKYQPNVLLVSSTLQYLRDPQSTLVDLLAMPWWEVILDRTPFLASGSQRLTVQHVPDWIYRASYPAWFFCEADTVALVSRCGYTMVASWPGFDVVELADDRPYFKGFIFQRGVGSK